MHLKATSQYKKSAVNKTVTPEKYPVSKKKKSRFFETYISKVLRQVSPDNGITSNSKQQLNSALCIVARELSKTVIRLTEISKKKTMSDKEVSNAVRVVFSGAMSRHSIREGEKSVLKFSAKSSKGSSRQGKAGIIFPPSIAEKFLRNFGYSKVMVTSNAPVFLAAVLEYLTAEILEMAANSATDNKRIRITIRDIQIAVGNDSELSNLFLKLNLSFLGGGVLPHIYSCLLSKKPRKKRKVVDAPGIKKPHRFRPGTVALREIKKFQKMSNCLTFAKFPFERLVRNIVNKTNNKMKISKDVFIILQYYIEQYVVNLLKDANAAAIHSGRVKLMIGDIKFICSLRGSQINLLNETLPYEEDQVVNDDEVDDDKADDDDEVDDDEVDDDDESDDDESDDDEADDDEADDDEADDDEVDDEDEDDVNDDDDDDDEDVNDDGDVLVDE